MGSIKEKELPAQSENNIRELVISEVMSNNSGIYVSDKGDICDYLELYNGTGHTINLNGYGLSDKSNTVKWLFSDVEIGSGEYLVVSLTGRLEDGLNAPFRLKANGGEELFLVNHNGKVVDAVNTVRLSKNQTMMRDANGQWFISDIATPGFSNDEKGRDSYIASLYSDEKADVVINELLLKEKGNYPDPDGMKDGYIELLNVSDHTIDLSSFYLSGNETVPFRYRLPAVSIRSGETYCLYFGENNIDFDGPSGNVILSEGNKIRDIFTYTDLKNGVAMMRDENGSYYSSAIISPGYANTVQGVESFQKKALKNPDTLIINEVMTKNDSYLPHNGYEHYDWVELKNNSKDTIDLSDYCLSKDDKDLSAYALPDIELQSGEFIVLMCSGDASLSNDTYYHLGFKLSDLSSLYLSKNGNVIDCVFIPELPYDYSYGRGADDGFFYYAGPTPFAENGSGVRTQMASPELSMDAGIYDNGLTLSISGPGTVYYTTDGSLPTRYSQMYNGPVSIDKTMVVRAISAAEGAMDSPAVYASYIIKGDHDLPVMSITIDPVDFYYLNANAGTKGLEYQAYVDFYEEDGGFSIPCSISAFGGNARWQTKKSYALRFSKEFGPSQLNYKIFDNRDNSVYQALVLRTGSTDWTEAYMRDILSTSLVDDYTDVEVQAYKTCVVYINGNYWGLYNIREKINKSFIEEHFNIPAETVNIARIDGQVTAGSNAGYNELRNFCNTHDISKDENYDYLCEHLDMEELCDYWIAETFTTNNDILNCRFYQSDEYDDGKWHYIYYDQDYAFYNINVNYYTQHMTNIEGMGGTNHFENTIIRNLFKNARFRELWLERLAYNLQYTWNPDITVKRLEEIHEMLEPEMEHNLERWNLSRAHYEESVDFLRNFLKNRPAILLQQTKSFFGLSNDQMKERFGDLWQ